MKRDQEGPEKKRRARKGEENIKDIAVQRAREEDWRKIEKGEGKNDAPKRRRCKWSITQKERSREDEDDREDETVVSSTVIKRRHRRHAIFSAR